jgi:hypothetical protein
MHERLVATLRRATRNASPLALVVRTQPICGVDRGAGDHADLAGHSISAQCL